MDPKKNLSKKFLMFGRIVLFSGIIFLSVTLVIWILETIHGINFNTFFVSSMWTIGILIFIYIAIIVDKIKSSRYKNDIFMIIFGLIVTLFGIVGTLILIKGDITGVYVIGFVPIPLIIITLIAACLGPYLVHGGIVSILKIRPKPKKGRRLKR